MSSLTVDLALLPPTPTHTETAPLVFTYHQGQGTLLYGDRPLIMAYSYTKTVITNTYPEGRTQNHQHDPAPTFPCSVWEGRFSRWAIAPEQIYSGQTIVDHQSDTGQEWRNFSGFKFNETNQQWRCTWHYRDRQEVFNSTFYYSKDVELALDLLDYRGSYSEYEYSDIAS